MLKKSNEGTRFNELRLIINGINYYGREIKKEEFTFIILNLKKLIEQFKK